VRSTAKLPFDGFQVCGIIGNVSFRPLNSIFRRFAIVGLACLAFAGAAHAGEGSRDIEVVPFHDSRGTNFSQLPQNESKNFNVWQPVAPHSVVPSSPGTKLTPLPRSQQSVTKEEQQLLDRRRNWVFMRPEDYATMDSKTGKNVVGTDNESDDNLTAMERYYHRLEQPGKPSATNDFSQMNPDRSSAGLNSFAGTLPNTDVRPFGATPFNSTPEAGVFQPLASADSAKVFKNESSDIVLSSDEVRIQAEQKAHMENFKQLWDIDQASSAAAPVIAPTTGPIDSAPLFGASTPSLSSPFGRGNVSSTANSSAASSKAAGSAAVPLPPPRTTPPHSDFMPISRAF
jgi:hypothetical protein